MIRTKTKDDKSLRVKNSVTLLIVVVDIVLFDSRTLLKTDGVSGNVDLTLVVVGCCSLELTEGCGGGEEAADVFGVGGVGCYFGCEGVVVCGGDDAD